MMPLGLLSAGETGEILAVRTAQAVGGSREEGGRCDCRVEDLGLRVGCTVQMLNNTGGPVLLKVGEARLAVDRCLAMKIMIKGVAR
ncbi:FeoA family protein [Geomonas sp.]|uniref:FeoA family protein n=1 Tax=Geomonas sp. TaxID=2651584 RepID=UPI002B468500|nr:FeoA family protein [Geomonas sp.]HJV33849.1 FeoA family protein [Geomonas sp.]